MPIPSSRLAGRMLQLDDAAAEALENYLNAAPPGRPYLDYRPETGPYLFPSARTGGSLSLWTICRLKRRHATKADDAPPGNNPAPPA